MANELFAATINGQMLDAVLGKLDFPEADLSFLASLMITPGRNYATYYSMADPIRKIGYYSLGPYKQVPKGMFQYKSWSDVPVTFNDESQFIKETIHEMTHLLLGDSIHTLIGDTGNEYVDLLTPLQATMESSYGALADNPTKYIDELITRAYTLEIIRTFCGEADFRQMAAEELPFTRGYAVLIWKYLHETLAAHPGGITVDELMSGIPARMKAWTQDDLRPFSDYNESSMSLEGFFGEFIEAFYAGNPNSFAIVFDSELPQLWRDEFSALLSYRLGVPSDIQVLNDPGSCPFVIQICVDTPTEFNKQLWFSGLSIEDVEQKTRDAGLDPSLSPLVICKETTETGTTYVSWHMLSENVHPSEIVPYYFISVTHILSIAGEPEAFDTLTEETLQVMEWLK